MSVAECISKLVAAGVINRQIADEALGLFDRSKAEFGRTMGPADADAAAALAVAKSMEAGAKKLKNDAAKQALAWADFEARVLSHPKGRIAGLMSALTRDIWETQRTNVWTSTEINWADLSRRFKAGMDAYMPGVLGQSKEQIAGVQNLIREVFGVGTGDRVAKAAAAGWKSATDEAVARMQSAGRNFENNDDWRVPQFWDQQRVRRFGKEEFQRDLQEQVDAGAMVLWDRDTGQPATKARAQFILDRAYSDIIVNDSGGGVFHPEQRTFQFQPGEAGAEAWLKLQQKYATGDNVFGMLTGHLGKMAREIALSEVIGPNHQAIVRAALRHAREEAGERLRAPLWERLNPVRLLESPRRIEQTYDVLTGKANAVESQLMAGVMGGLRSINTAAKLQGAVLSAVPGDTVTAGLAASYNGMPVGRLLDGVFRELSRGGEESRALAARLHLVANSTMDANHGLRFFQDQIGGPETLRWLSTTMIRAQGLAAWTELMKRTFTMEFMGHLSDMARHSLDDLRGVNRPTANFLERAQITPAEWDIIRATKPMEADGVRFMDMDAISDKALRDKLLGAIIDERAFAVLEPDARIRAITTQGQAQGTFVGEMARSLFLFKSFSMTMMATHMMRLTTQEGVEGFLRYAAPFVLLHFMAGAAAMQAKNIVYGKDPEDMTTAKFWAKAFATGGGLGLYGDMLNSASSKSNTSFLAEFGGPALGAADDIRRLTFAQARKAYEGSETTAGAEAVRTLKRYTPGVFYTRLAMDRLVFDQMQTLVDPDYRQSFRRMEKRMQDDTGQEFWWRPGRAAPSRAPDLGAAF